MQQQPVWCQQNNRKGKFQGTAEEFKNNLLKNNWMKKNLWSINTIMRVEYKAVRRMAIDEKVRLDGRKTTDIRPIWSEVGYLRSHGSAVFTWQTQSLTTVTLGTNGQT